MVVSELLDEDARMSVDCVRNESCEFADGVMREYDVVDVSVESDVNESDVVLFCDGKLMIAELVVAMLEVVPFTALVVVVPLIALVVVVVPLIALVVVELPTLVVMVDVLHHIDSVPGYDSYQDAKDTYPEVAVDVPLSAVVVTIELVDVVVIVWLPDTVVIVVTLTESVVDEPEPEDVIVAETLPEPVEEREPVADAEPDVEERGPVADAEPDVEDEHPSPIPRMQIDRLALEDVPFEEPVAEALTESVVVAEPLEESVVVAEPLAEPVVVAEPLEEPVVVAEPLEESVADALAEDEPDAPEAVDDALSVLLEHPSPRPRIQIPLVVVLAELDESVAVAVPDALEESVADAELDEPVALLSVADALDDALSLLEQSPRPRTQIPPLPDVLVGSAELVADDSEAEAGDVAESDAVLALLASVDDATEDVETGVALDGSVVLAADELAAEDAALVGQLPRVIPRRSTQPLDELALVESLDEAAAESLDEADAESLDEAEAESLDEAEAESLDDAAEVVDADAEVADAVDDAEDEATLEALALRDVDVAGTSAVVPGAEVELEQPCVIPRSGIQSPPCPSFAAKRQ